MLEPAEARTSVDEAAIGSRRTLQSRLLRSFFGVVCFFYLLQLWSPLRLSGDSIEILSVAASAADGHGFLDHGNKTRYSTGYPAMIALLDRAGTAGPWSLVGLNATFLFLGLLCARYIALNYFHLSREWSTLVLLFTALSFALVKHFTIPLTDIPFFGTSLAALALVVCAARKTGNAYYRLWMAALATSIISVLIRPTAIALFPCLVWSIGSHLGVGRFLLNNRRALVGTAASGIVFTVLAATLLLRTIYVRGALMVFAHEGLGRGLMDTLRYRVTEIGELSLNAPTSRLGPLAPIIWFAGILGIGILIRYALRCKINTVEIYLAGYLFIVMIWPYGDPRFWVPALPLILAELFSLAHPWTFRGWTKYVGLAYSGGYALMGLAALAYSTWITFSGPNFPNRYGDGKLRATYELFYSNAAVEDPRVDMPALEVLRRYGGQEAK